MPTSHTASIVRLENVDVEIDGRRVLHGIRLALNAGEHWGFVGANGSGKSTLLALIAGRRWPAPGRGKRRYDFGAGPECDAVSARDRIALLGHELQDLYAARNWNFRVEDIVLSGLTRTDIPQRKRPPAALTEARTMLERLRLDHLADRRILELSRGEQRRVLIARALAFKPALLLLDEPASGLDAESRRELETMLASTAALTQLAIAAHRESELPGIVNRRAWIAAGRLHPVGGAVPVFGATPVAAGPELRVETAPAPGGAPDQERAPQQDSAPGQDQAPRQDSAPGQDQAPPQDAAPGQNQAPPEDAARLPDRPSPDASTRSAPTVLVALERASVFIGGRPVLRELDWQLRTDQHWLVTGPNGAGKSSLLRLLNAELRPALGGTVRWPGLGEPASVWALRRQIALVSAELQARYRYPATVFDAVASGFTASIGRVREPSPEQRARIETLLADFGLDELAGRLLGSLSYGQRRRALIARTLATAPRVLLLDEPWEGLDAASCDVVRRELIRCAAQGTQIVCVSHVGTGGLPLNRVLRLEAGRIVNAGDSAGPGENSASARCRAASCPPH